MRNRTPDFEAMVVLLPTAAGGRSRPASSGYRPSHAILPEVLTTGQHDYQGATEVQPGSSATTLITLIAPDEYPGSLWPGKRIRVQEGGRVVGHAVVRRVLNPVLAPVPTPVQAGPSFALPINDPSWRTMEGGYRTPYDPRSALDRAGSDDEGERSSGWKELWENLHHQGDVGTASYAALPHLVALRGRRGIPDWQVFALSSIIEAGRLSGSNPELPAQLANGYRHAWEQLLGYALEDLRRDEDPDLVRSALAVVAFARGMHVQGRMLSTCTDDEIQEFLDE